ncbi:hypothetical protein L6164_017760 [Bauhinia variegata]|uniref:Uncharacterized protein n=1 Tax=Bauhinia variegata TaxID=167791 RepID=A0ACB9N9K1_BAUVA|nr:hypothetical protein L6164_017760 [Bauhinia variegata]
MEHDQEPQRVAVIHDASRDVSSEGIKNALEHLNLKSGDELALVAILERFNSPMGYKIKVDTNSFISTNEKILEEEIARKTEDYTHCSRIQKLSEFCKERKISFRIEVLAGYTPEVAVKAALDLLATYLIFTRKVKKDTKYFMDKLSCGIIRIRSDNSLETIRVPKIDGKTTIEEPALVKYDEMIPGSAEKEFSPKRPRSSSSEQLMATGSSNSGSSESSLSNQASVKYRHLYHPEGQKAPVRKQEAAEKNSLFFLSESQEEDQTEVNHKGRAVDEQKKKKRSNNEASPIEEEFAHPLCSVCKNERPKTGTTCNFSYSELHAATRGFSDKNFISEGGFGSVYKGQLNGMTVAVKQHKNAGVQGEKEFKAEVNVLSKARHENVVMLLGSCSEGNNRLLVYEYVCNGSLDQHLSRKNIVHFLIQLIREHSRKPLSWENRVKIAIGVARGLLYLHENGIIHRDMRPNNILLTHDHQPLLGDFGLARTQNQDSIHSTEVVGALGYLAPEYAELGKVSTKTDVYSFGVVLLQLITGMRTTDKRLGGRSLVGWARPLLRERNYPDLVDERVTDGPDFHQLFWMVRIAEKCLSRDPQKRLHMLSVVNALTGLVEGNTCGIIIRDSYYSSSESDDESEDEEKKSSKSESEDESETQNMISAEFTSSSSTSQMSQMIAGYPLSPPLAYYSNKSTTYKVFDEFTFDSGDQNERETGICLR